MATQKPRFTVTMDEELYEAVEDFRFGFRINTKSEATAELIRIALEAIKNGEVSIEDIKKGKK